MTWPEDADELRRLLDRREQRRVRSVPGGVRFSVGSREAFVPDSVVFDVLQEREPARRERQLIDRIVRRLVG